MTEQRRDIEADERGSPPPHPALPLVSVVVVNYNYGRFLEEAVGSVFAQSYSRLECIVVDNGSTDESSAILDTLLTHHPALAVIRRARNEGQTVACLEGLARSRGPYVVFLDADDYLLPHCVATHVAVHLASRVHVGFTSGDMLQCVDGEVVLTTSEAICNVVAKQKRSPRDDLLRPAGELRERAAELSTRVCLVPRDQRDWAWAPMSGNCFRRDALDMVCDAEGLGALASQTDLFLALALHAVSGSILIDEPLFAYRLHGSNVFSNRPQLQGRLSFDAKRSAGPAVLARQLLLDQLVSHVDRFVHSPWMVASWLATLDRIDIRVAEPGAWQGGSYAARAVQGNVAAVAAAVGRTRAWWFVLRGAPWRRKADVLLGKASSA